MVPPTKGGAVLFGELPSYKSHNLLNLAVAEFIVFFHLFGSFPEDNKSIMTLIHTITVFITSTVRQKVNLREAKALTPCSGTHVWSRRSVRHRGLPALAIPVPSLLVAWRCKPPCKTAPPGEG